MKPKRKHPPARDFDIDLDGVSAAALTDDLMKECVDATLSGQRVRGSFLALFYELERAVDTIIKSTLFPDGDTAQCDAFEDCFLRQGTQFARKIQILRQLAEIFEDLGKLLSKELINRIDKLRELRNDFAHCPILLVPEKGTSSPGVSLILQARKEEFVIDRKFIRNKENECDGVLIKLKEVICSIRQGPGAVDPALAAAILRTGVSR